MYAIEMTLDSRVLVGSRWDHHADAIDALEEGTDCVPIGFRAVGGRAAVVRWRPGMALASAAQWRKLDDAVGRRLAAREEARAAMGLSALLPWVY